MKKVKKTIASVAAVAASASAIAGMVITRADYKSVDQMDREAEAAANDPNYNGSVSSGTWNNGEHSSYGGDWSPVTDSNGNLIGWRSNDSSGSGDSGGDSGSGESAYATPSISIGGNTNVTITSQKPQTVTSLDLVAPKQVKVGEKGTVQAYGVTTITSVPTSQASTTLSIIKSGQGQTTGNVRWSVSGDANISGNGSSATVTFTKPGTATVTAVVEYVSGSYSWSDSSTQSGGGGNTFSTVTATTTVTCTGSGSDYSDLVGKTERTKLSNATWTVTPSTILEDSGRTDGGDLVVNGVARGVATVTATAPGFGTASANINVIENANTTQSDVSAATTYTVAFDANGHGTAPSNQTVAEGEKATKPADLTADGWTFGGWYTDKECTQAVDWDAAITSDLTYYAKWTDATVYPQSISLDSDNYTVEVNGTKQASVTFDPADTTNKDVTWEITSGGEFASVDENGLIHGLKKGEATLKATAVAKDADGKEVSATAKVTVVDSSNNDEGKATVTFVSEYGTVPDPVTVDKGSTIADPGSLTAEGYNFQGWYTSQAYNIAADFTAPINEDTTFYAKWEREAPFKTTILFDANGGTIDGKTSATKDYAMSSEAQSITIDNIPVATREGYTLTGWNSSADGSGTQLNNGDAIAAEAGNTHTFYAQWTANTKEPTGVQIQVPDVKPSDDTPRPSISDLNDPSISWINIDDITIHVGDVVPMKAVVSPEDATATTKTWQATDPSIASISQDGVLTGKTIGTTTVSVTLANGVNDTATVHVVAAEPTDFDIDFGTSGGRVKVGDTIQLGTKNWSPDGLPDTSKAVSWNVTNGTGSATIDENGRLTGVSEGTVTVTATSKVKNGLSKSAVVTVYSEDIEPTGTDIVDPISRVSINDMELKIGESKGLDAVVIPANANTKTGKTWSIADPSIATVNQNGTVTGVSAGTTVVTVTLENGVKDTAIIKVLPDAPTDIEPTGADIIDPRTGISVSDIELQEGQTKQVAAVITPANANVKTGKTWSIGDPAIATVDQYGNVTGVKAGTTIVTVTLENGVKDTAVVKVTPKPSTDIEPTGISIGAKDIYLYVGNSKTLTATITPANANVHTEKSWRIYDSSIAVVDQNGTVTGVKVGTTTVVVTLANGVSDTATVHVLDTATPSYTVNFNGNGGSVVGNSTATATADAGYTLYSNSFPTATRQGYNFAGWNTAANGTGTWVTAPHTFNANTSLYAQWSNATIAPTSVDISVPVTTINPNGTVNTTYVSADSMSLKVGETKPIKVTVLPANATDKSVTYSIADPSIARIDQNGNITGLRAGVTTATVRTVNGLTDTISVVVTPNSSIPNLYIENIKSEYPAGKTIPVTLNILDADRGERLYVYYQIDNEIPVLADTITSTGYWQTVGVDLPSNISIGKHAFTFFVRDAAGNRSDDRGNAYVRGTNGYYYDPNYRYTDPYYNNGYYDPYYRTNDPYYYRNGYYYGGDAYITDVAKYNPNRNDPRTWGTRFKADITNTAPTLSLAARLQDKVKIGEDLPANLTVKDDNVGQKVTIYYQIDSGNPVEAGSFVSDGNAKNISVNIPTGNVSEGDHVVTFYAVDEAGAKSNANGNVNAWSAMNTNAGANQQTVNFTKGDGNRNSGYSNNGGNAPIVDIFKANGYKTTEDVTVTISVLEKDAGQKVTTYYSLDNGAETVIKSFKSTGKANTQPLNLGRLSEGVHTLEVWAIDEDGNRSDAADGLYTFSVSRTDNGTVTVTPQPTVYNTSTIKTGVEAKGSKAGIAAAIVGAVAAVSGAVLKKKRK